MSTTGWSLENTYTQLPQLFFKDQMPSDIPNPKTVVLNEPLAGELGLDAGRLQATPALLSGGALPEGARPIAQAYAGHQYGHFTMLGDGRAVLLGEQITPEGRRFDIQLKGAGKTPFSRRGDGLAALSPMLREYIVSEAMFALGIPTTRSLAVVTTGREVIRETALQGAVLTRVAASHIRVGTFEYASAFGSGEDLRALADYSIARHFPRLQNREEKYRLLLREVCWLQADLIAQWQLVGFVHGVMNTDNMTISGETIDYGPCAFMDVYHPDTVFSSIDAYGRYAYKNQPAIGAWNLSRLAETLLPLLSDDQEKAVALAEKEISDYWEHFGESWISGMRAKLGLTTEEPEDAELIGGLLDLMATHKLDYTNTFRALSFAGQATAPVFNLPGFASWQAGWQGRLARQPERPSELMDLMKSQNPAVIPRNHRVEEALAAAEKGNLRVMEDLLAALRNPFKETEGYAAPPEETACKYQTFCGT